MLKMIFPSSRESTKMKELMDSSNKNRKNYIDWLRIFTILFIFVAHCSRYFMEGGPIENDQKDVILGGIRIFGGIWVIRLMFLLSGMSNFYSINPKNWKDNIKRRLLRLGVPFVVSLFIVIPFVPYFIKMYNGDFSGTIFEFYPTYFNGIYGYGGEFRLTGEHMWFVLYILLFSLNSLPLFVFLKKSENIKYLNRIGQFLSKKRMFFVLLILTVTIRYLSYLLIPQPTFDALGGFQVPNSVFFYLLGFFFGSLQKKKKFFKKLFPYSFVIGIFTTFFVYLMYHTIIIEILYILCLEIASLCWILIFLYLAQKYVDFYHPSLKIFNKISLPFFILHFSTTLMVGGYILKLSLPVISKFLIICGVAFLLTLAIIGIIWVIKPLRPLFGFPYPREKKR